MNMRHKVLWAAAASVIGVSAHAGFVIERNGGSSAAKALRAATTTVTVREIGSRPGNLPVLNGMGKAIPLRTLLAYMVPSTFDVQVDGVGANLPASWEGGRAWPDVLAASLDGVGLAALIDWESRRVFVGPMDKREAVATSVARVVSPATGALIAAPVHPRFRLLRQDIMVSRALKRWGEEAGWTVIWDAPKQAEIASDADFEGPFEKAVETLVHALKDTDNPIRATFHSNRAVRIERFNGNNSLDSSF